jgi:hypothetical protein
MGNWSESSPVHQIVEKWAAIQNSQDSAAMYDRLIRKICKEVDYLHDFTSTDPGADIERASDHAPPTSSLIKWIGLRDHTHNLHCKLSHIWSYNCAAQQHQSKIRITLPMEEAPQEDLSFYYSFLLHSDANSGQWRSVKIVSRYDNRHLTYG